MNKLEKISEKMTNWVGTPASIVFHTLLFIGIFALRFLNISLDDILLILTTAVSLEAIYLAIFIQMTVNRTTKSLAGVEKDIDDIQEDVDDIQEDVKEISEDYEENEEEENALIKAIKDVEKRLEKLHQEVIGVNKKPHKK